MNATRVDKNHHHLAVFGASRGVGRAVLEQALAAGHRVTALVRSPGTIEPHPNLVVHVGDALNASDVAQVVSGTSAVVCALGAPALSRSTIRSEGTRLILDAMEAHGVSRLVAVSLYGARETRSALPPFLRYVFFPLYLFRAVREHEQQEDAIERSGLAWTIVRPPHLSDGPRTGRYEWGFDVDDIDRMSLKVSRADVADLIMHSLTDDSRVGRALAVSYAC